MLTVRSERINHWNKMKNDSSLHKRYVYGQRDNGLEDGNRITTEISTDSYQNVFLCSFGWDCHGWTGWATSDLTKETVLEPRKGYFTFFFFKGNAIW